jgi:hypothetical protein
VGLIMTKRRIITGPGQVPRKQEPPVSKPAAPALPALPAHPAIKPAPPPLTSFPASNTAAQIVGYTADGRPIKATSSYAPKNTDEQFYWDLYVEEFARYPSGPDLKTYMVRTRAIQAYDKHLLQELSKALAQVEKPAVDKTLLAGLQASLGTTEARKKYLRGEFTKLQGLEAYGMIGRAGALDAVMQLAQLIAALPPAILKECLPPSVLAAAGVAPVSKPHLHLPFPLLEKPQTQVVEFSAYETVGTTLPYPPLSPTPSSADMLAEEEAKLQALAAKHALSWGSHPDHAKEVAKISQEMAKISQEIKQGALKGWPKPPQVTFVHPLAKAKLVDGPAVTVGMTVYRQEDGTAGFAQTDTPLGVVTALEGDKVTYLQNGAPGVAPGSKFLASNIAAGKSETVKAVKPRKLKAKWTIDAAPDLNAMKDLASAGLISKETLLGKITEHTVKSDGTESMTFMFPSLQKDFDWTLEQELLQQQAALPMLQPAPFVKSPNFTKELTSTADISQAAVAQVLKKTMEACAAQQDQTKLDLLASAVELQRMGGSSVYLDELAEFAKKLKEKKKS